MNSRRQNCGFEHRVLSPIESQEISQHSPISHAGDDVRPLLGVVERFDFKRIPTARLRKNQLVAGRRRAEAGQGARLTHCRLGQQLNIVIWDPKIYYFTRIPSVVNPMHALYAVSGFVISSAVGALLPAIRAAMLHPVKALRFE